MADINGLIAEADKATLYPASYVKGIADGAKLASDKAAVARIINEAANTGEHSVEINYPLSEDVIEALKGEGYAVTPCGKVNPKDHYRIDFIGGHNG